MICLKNFLNIRHTSFFVYSFGFLLSTVFALLFFGSSVSAAVPGSNNVRVYTSYMNMNTQEYDPVTSTAVNNEDVQVLYPVVDQLSGVFRLLFYPVMTAQSGVKGISIKNIDIMFYTDTPTDPVLDRQVCSHIMAGYGSGGWTSSVSNCGFWTSWTSGERYAYTHFHFDLTLIPTDGNSSINITGSDLSPFYVTLGTTQYNVNNTIPVYERTLIASSHPVYFGTINYGAITYTKSTTDTLLQDVINHQDATTEAVRDLEQTTISNTNRITSSIDDLREATEDAEDGEQARWEADHQEQDDKEDELEDQAGDLSLSASSTGNPFASLFNASGCVPMPTVGGWFGSPNLKVCSPYPATIAGVLNFVGSAVVVGLLIKIYYKHMNGGYQS